MSCYMFQLAYTKDSSYSKARTSKLAKPKHTAVHLLETATSNLSTVCSDIVGTIKPRILSVITTVIVKEHSMVEASTAQEPTILGVSNDYVCYDKRPMFMSSQKPLRHAPPASRSVACGQCRPF